MTSPSIFLRPRRIDAAPTRSLAELLLETPALRRSLSAEAIDELQSIARERAPDLRDEALLSFAQRLEREENTRAALHIYEGLANQAPGEEASPLRSRATERWNALQGRGPWQNRVEDMARHFVAQATDPAMIFAFGFAGGVAGLVRTGSLASLATRAPSLFSGGLGARALAGTAGYLAEVPVFVGAHRAARSLLHPAAAQGGWGEELGSAALFLGALKFTGFLARELPVSSALAPGLRHGATGLGIYLGQRLEERFHLRPESEGGGRWVDLAATWLQLHVGGRIAAGLPGLGGTAPLEHALGYLPLRTQAETFRRLPRSGGFEASLRRQAAAEVDDFDDGPTNPNFRLDLDPLARLSSALGERCTDTVLVRAGEIGTAMGDREAFFRLLARSQVLSAPELESALLRLRHSLSHARAHGFGGNYVDSISRFALAKILRIEDARSLDAMLLRLNQGGPLREYEQWVGSLFEGYRLVPAGLLRQLKPIPGYLISRNPVHRRIRSLPISLYGRDLLHRFADAQVDLTESQIAGLERALQPASGMRELMERILTVARPSPLSYLRVWRMMGLVQNYANHLPRLQELAGVGWPLAPAARARPYPIEAGELTNSVDDAFMNDADLSGLLGEFYESLPRYLDPAARQERRLRASARLAKIWSGASGLDRAGVLRSLRALGDPISLRVAESLETDRLDFRILGTEEMRKTVLNFYPQDAGADLPKGLFIMAKEGLPRDTIFLLDMRPASHPALVLDRLGTLVHEHEHFLRPPLRPRTTASGRAEEMIAVLRSLQWRAEHGEISALEQMLADSPVSFAMSLRNFIEQWYLSHPSDPG